jgi:hypothetical protein
MEAARLRLLAAKEIEGSTVKDQLLDLAAEYEKLAREAEDGSYSGGPKPVQG